MFCEWNNRNTISELNKKWTKERPKNYSENLTVLLWNCEGLSTHLADLDILLSYHSPHIMILTGVGKQIRYLPKIPYYYWHSQEGDNSFGGVAILVHVKLKSTVLKTSINFLLIELEISNQKINIAAVYVPPKNTPPFELFQTHDNNNIIIFGDFNAKHQEWGCEKNNPSGNRIKEWMENEGWNIIHPSKPTSKKSKSIIDFAIVQDNNGWNAETLDEGTLDHYPVIFFSPFAATEDGSFRATNWKMFYYFLQSIFSYWNSLVYNMDHDAFFEIFSAFLAALWDRCSEYKYAKAFRTPWPPYLVTIAKNVNKYKRKYRRTRFLNDFNVFLCCKNEFLQEKNSYLQKQKENKLKDMKINNNVWSYVKNTFRSYSPAFKGLTTSNGIIKDNKDIVNILANHYEKHFEQPIYDLNNPYYIECINAYKEIENGPNLPLQKIEYNEVLKQWKSLASKKSLDSTNTSAYLLKNLPSEYLNIITVLFNKCVENGSFFNKSKYAKGICLSKDGMYPTKDRLRSISLLPNLGKWLEKIIAERIEKWCDDKGIHTDEQSGFTAHRRLQTRIVSLIEDLRLTVAASNRPAIVIFIDFKTAFDRVWYPSLMKTLQKLEMPQNLIRWTYNWLQNRSIFISHGDAESRPIKTFVGAPQGSTLSALLFRLHIFFLPSYFPHIVSHLYADDLTLVIKGALEKKLSDNITYLEEQAKHTMLTLAKFADDHILPVNIEKTKIMLVHSAVAPLRPRVEYKNIQIEYVNNFKCLGVDVGTKLGWSKHIDNRLKKARSSYCALRKIFSEIPKDEIQLRRKLFCAFSLPHFFWLLFLWFYYTEKQRAKIEHVYISGLRLVYGLCGWDDYTTLILSRDYTLRDYIFKYWKKFMKHLDESSEALTFQQTWTAFLIATSPCKSYYKSMGFRKNSKFPNRLSAQAQHIKLDVITFFNNHNKQYSIFKKSTAMIEYFVLKFFPP
ncbi:unnamed protein product [Rotaria magnacalcarata]|uniref:Reverse transcriptase domain-containing protein n=1 Tax=Rotaria magnacalcarata TaxID=392030 RepID=A0A816H0C2_9BILA|nr:unnamed protein product [Rotaria magnacalcarata]CAF4072155.1 unnamed protein product [Rotaria magnacalcarata]